MECFFQGFAPGIAVTDRLLNRQYPVASGRDSRLKALFRLLYRQFYFAVVNRSGLYVALPASVKQLEIVAQVIFSQSVLFTDVFVLSVKASPKYMGRTDTGLELLYKKKAG